MNEYPDENVLPNFIRASKLPRILAEWAGLKVTRQSVWNWMTTGRNGHVLLATKRVDPGRPSAEIYVVRRDDLCQFLRDALGVPVVIIRNV